MPQSPPGARHDNDIDDDASHPSRPPEPELSASTTSDQRLDEFHTEAALLLGSADQRYTGSRRALVESLARADRPLSIPEVLASAPGVPQSSAYRNLAVLVDAGVVRRVQGTGDNGRFELAEGLSGDHHHHLICTDCGLVADIASSIELERALEAAARAAAESAKFLVVDHRFDLVGLCADCNQP